MIILYNRGILYMLKMYFEKPIFPTRTSSRRRKYTIFQKETFSGTHSAQQRTIQAGIAETPEALLHRGALRRHRFSGYAIDQGQFVRTIVVLLEISKTDIVGVIQAKCVDPCTQQQARPAVIPD